MRFTLDFFKSINYRNYPFTVNVNLFYYGTGHITIALARIEFKRIKYVHINVFKVKIPVNTVLELSIGNFFRFHLSVL